MSQSTLQSVKKNLSAKFYATNDIWLKDCVEYYLSEHETPDDLEVLEFAISQWQLSDLREISNEKPCLPKNLAQQTCVTLRGCFVLQMEKVYDIGESKYKQLEKIRNVSIENIQVTESEATQAWEPKKKRMLYFHLTDGAQNITAIEYKPIRFLNAQLLPGFKLMIKGPITCRRGVIMLDETNVSEVGGEVETLLIPNALENVLARALNLPENPDPYNDNVKPNASEDVLFDDDFDVDLDAVELIEKLSQEESTIITNSRSLNPISNVQSTSNKISNRSVEPKNEIANNPSPVPLIHETESDLLFEMIDENEFENIPKIVCSPRTVPRVNCKNPVRVLPRQSEFPDDDDDVIVMTDDPNFFGDDDDDWQVRDEKVKSDCKIDEKSKTNIVKNEKSVEISSLRPATAVVTTNPGQPGIKRTASVLSPPVHKQPAEKVRCTQNTPKAANKTNVRKITDFMKKHDRPDMPSSAVVKICDTVDDLLNANDVRNVVRKTVRGKLGKFDKLGRNGEFWEFNATIIDHTGSIDAAFSSEILEKMLGFSVAEFKMQKKLKKNNPEIEHRLRQGFRSAESKLKNLDALLDIELTPGQKPKVVQIRDMTEEQRQTLDKTANIHTTT